MPKLAKEAPAETVAFTLMRSPDGSQNDGIARDANAGPVESSAKVLTVT